MRKGLLVRRELQFNNSAKKFKYIVMGDSHLEFAINPNILDDSFNYCSGAESYIQTYYKFKDLLSRKDVTFETLILPWDLNSLMSYRSKTFYPHYYWSRYLDYLEIGLERKELPSFLLTWTKANIFPYIGESNNFKNYFTSIPLNKMELGYRYTDMDFSKLTSEQQTEGIKTRIQQQFKGFKDHDQILVKYFTKILTLARKHQKKVILVKSPLFKSYLEATQKYVNYQEHFKNHEDLLKSYTNIKVIDMHEEFLTEDNYFKDVDHLNSLGAIEFSKRLKVRL